MSSKYYDIRKLNDVEKKLYNIQRISHYGMFASDLKNCQDITNIINDYINKKLKDGNMATRNQLLLDKDIGYKTKWHNLLVKIDNLTLPIATKFELAKDIENLIDEAMTISSSHTEVDSIAWLRSNY